MQVLEKSHCSVSRDCKVISFAKITDERGELTIIEGSRHIPFQVKRVFFVQNPTTQRGNHAHRTLWELVVPIVGSLDVLVDNGLSEKTFNLRTENEGLLIPPLNWAQQKSFSSDCVYLVLASDPYNEDDYIRDHTEFLELARER